MPNARFTGVGDGDRVDHGVGQHRGDRADVGEVPALAAVAVHGERAPGERGVDEGRHDRGVGVARAPAADRTR